MTYSGVDSTSSVRRSVWNVALKVCVACLLLLSLPGGALASQSNAALSDLQLSIGQLVQPFQPGTLSYFASVPETEPSISVLPIASDPNAAITVRINGEEPHVVIGGSASPALALEIGTNVIVVDVTSSDASESQSYRLTIPKRAVRFQEGAGGYHGTIDTQINQAVRYVDHNLGAQHKFEVGYTGPWARDQKYAMIRFDKLSLPSEATITEATLNVWHFGDRVASGYDNLFPEKEVYMHRVRVPWTEGSGGTATSHDGSLGQPGETTWNSFMGEAAPFHFNIVDSAMVGTEPNWYSFELTDLANDWLKGTLPNYGVLLKTYEYPSNDDDRMTGTKQFRSSEYEVVSERPYLSVVYSMPLQGLNLDTDALSLKAGQDVVVTAFPRPLNAVYKDVNWSSSNEAVATVRAGVVTAVGKGEAVVTATISDGRASYTATVNVVVQ